MKSIRYKHESTCCIFITTCTQHIYCMSCVLRVGRLEINKVIIWFGYDKTEESFLLRSIGCDSLCVNSWSHFVCIRCYNLPSRNKNDFWNIYLIRICKVFTFARGLNWGRSGTVKTFSFSNDMPNGTIFL